MLIDTHCHLETLSESIEKTQQLCQLEKVDHLISIGVDFENNTKLIEMIDSFKNIYCTLGLHPHDAKSWNINHSNFIEQHFLHPKVIGIGETGLDYHYLHSTKEEQFISFNAHIKLTIDLDLPMVIHTREAEEDTWNILQKYNNDLQKVVFHSFSSNKTLAEKAISKGYFLGFNGMVTFKNADLIREIVSICPIDQIVIETDSPYLTPIPNRGKENSPSYLPYIAKKISEIKNIPLKDLENILIDNTLRLFPKLNNFINPHDHHQ